MCYIMQYPTLGESIPTYWLIFLVFKHDSFTEGSVSFTGGSDSFIGGSDSLEEGQTPLLSRYGFGVKT